MIRLKVGTRISISLSAFFIIILTLFFAFERVLVDISPVFGYIDEILAIIAAVEIIKSVLEKKKIFYKEEIFALISMILIAIIGLLGNMNYRLLNQIFPILIDVISIFKVFLVFYWIRMRRLETKDWDSVVIILAKIIRFFLLIMLITYIVSYYIDLGMLGEVRYGLKSYQFWFNNPGNFSKLFYFIIPLLTIDLYYKKTINKMIYIGIALFIWGTTLRSRAIAFIACYVLLSFWFFRLRKRKYKVKIIQFLPISLIGVILGWDQFIYYFTNENQARYQLMKYGIVTLKEYFPLGAGFGTYGSDVAVNYYSPLYTKYGFDKIYGMGYLHTNFLNDNYWPMIMGQFGLIGTILIIYILYSIYNLSFKCLKNNEIFCFATIIMAGMMLISSVASKSYSEYSMIPIFILHGIMFQRERNKMQSVERNAEEE